MQMIRSIFKVLCYFQYNFCELGSWFWWITFILVSFSVFVVIPKIQFPKNLCLCFCFLSAVEDEIVLVFEARAEMNS